MPVDDPVGCRGHPRATAWDAAGAHGRPLDLPWAPTEMLNNVNHCFRVGTKQTASEPVYELLVQTLRDAQQSVDASALQVCYCTRGEGAVLSFG